MNPIKQIQYFLESLTTGINGHFWLEYDGSIIDPYFKQYDTIRELTGLSEQKCYSEAESGVQKEMIRNAIMRSFSKVLKYKKDKGCYPPYLYNNCVINAFINKMKYPKGVIKYGSFGWYDKSGVPYFEYEHNPNENTMALIELKHKIMRRLLKFGTMKAYQKAIKNEHQLEVLNQLLNSF